jgi:hypothetical protein
MLKAMRAQDWNASFSYAPPLVDIVINTDHVVDATACDSRGSGPWMRVRMSDGKQHIVKGLPEELLK